MVRIVDASAGQAQGILEILAPEILHGVAHFGTSPPTLEELALEIERATRPWLVALDGTERVIGYARASAWKPREAYAWTTEIGVYVRSEARAQGVGGALYASLFPRLEAAGVRTVLAGIALPNEASVRLHERFGMRHVGTLPSVGFKHGRWLDVGYWHRRLGTPRALAET